MSNRRDTRVIAGIGTILTIGDESRPCMSGDISRGGMFVVTDQRAPEGTLVGIRLVHLGRRLEAHARVVSIKATGLGLSFVDASDEFRAAVRSMMDDMLGQSGAGPGPQSTARRASVSWLKPGGGKLTQLLRGRGHAAELTDLTLEGAALACKSCPDVGESIVLELTAEGDANPTTSSCSVIRHTEHGFAVRFVAPSIEFRRLVSLLRRGRFKKTS